MEKCEQCRWLVNKCTNPVVDEIKEDCDYFYDYNELENKQNNDNITDNLTGEIE